MIGCNEVMERVSESLLGGAPRDETVVRHLESCPSCREEARALEGVWRRVEELPEVEPGPGVRQRFEAMLREETAREEARAASRAAISWRDRLAALWDRPGFVPALGTSMAALIVGLLAGALLASSSPDPQVQGLQAEVGALREMVALSLLEQDSAIRRLEGVRYGSEAGSPQPSLQRALVDAVDRDPNVNVRLAALDALSPVAGETPVLNHLLRSLPEQDSPLVQIAMIDLLLSADGARARRVVGQLAEDPELPEEVRLHIRARLGTDA